MALCLLQCSWSVFHYSLAQEPHVDIFSKPYNDIAMGSGYCPGMAFDSHTFFPSRWRYSRNLCRSQWPRGLRRRSTAARLLRSWVRIPQEVWMSVCCECCVLSGRGLCDELTTRPEESYRLWCVAGCVIETSSMRSQTSINCVWTYEIS